MLQFALCAGGRAAGLPDGAVNVVAGPGGVAGQALLVHPLVDKVAFTGDSSTGRQVMRACADGLKKVSLELGGKSPNVVFADADIEAASRGALNAIFYNKGEVCAAGSRLLVEEAVREGLLARISELAARIRVGDPTDHATRMGPVISRGQIGRPCRTSRRGRARGRGWFPEGPTLRAWHGAITSSRRSLRT